MAEQGRPGGDAGGGDGGKGSDQGKRVADGHARGDVIVVRYAEDFVLGFQHRGEAERFRHDLRERLNQFGLTLHPDETRLLEFGRFAAENRERRGAGKPPTFHFLGFTHICARTRKNGKFTVRRQSMAKRMAAKLRLIRDELRQRRHEPVPKLGEWLGSVVRGWLNYHAVPGNTARIEFFRDEAVRHWFRMLTRRGQKDKLTWSRFGPLALRWIPRARILHPYPPTRFHARHPR